MKQIKFSFLFFVSSIFFNSSGFLHAQKLNDSLNYYYNLSIKSKKSGDLAKSYLYFKKLKEINLNQKDLKNAVYDLSMMAKIQKDLALYSESEKTSVEALELLDKLPEDSSVINYKIGIYNNLGIIYRKIGDYDKSIELYNKIKALNTNPKNNVTIINNIGNVYNEQKKYNLALKTYKEAYKKSLLIKDKKLIARILSNLGRVQSKLNNPESIINLQNALRIRDSLNYLSGVNTSYDHLTEYYKDQNETEMALIYANKTLELAKSRNNIEYQEVALSNLIELNEFPSSAKYIILKDSIQNSKQLSKDNFTFYKYQFQEQESKLEVSLLKTQRTLIALSLISIISILVYYLQRNKHKKGKLEQVLITETRISKKIHDVVANDIYQVMTKIQSDNTQKETVLDDLENIYIKTRDISKENSSINVNDDFEKVLNDLLLSYKSDTVTIITRNSSKINWKSVAEIKKVTIYRVLQELMTNMKKHSKASIVVLVFSNNKKLIINYKDNGIGCELNKNTGLQNVENRINSIQGLITFETEINNGFKSIITI
jgi:tetratricopeptide (TPR) repeat protein